MNIVVSGRLNAVLELCKEHTVRFDTCSNFGLLFFDSCIDLFFLSLRSSLDNSTIFVVILAKLVLILDNSLSSQIMEMSHFFSEQIVGGTLSHRFDHAWAHFVGLIHHGYHLPERVSLINPGQVPIGLVDNLVIISYIIHLIIINPVKDLLFRNR